MFAATRVSQSVKAPAEIPGYRYWRIFVVSNGGFAGVVINEIQMFDATLGSNVIRYPMPWFASADEVRSGGSAIDGDTSTYWSSGGDGSNQYIGVDFGVRRLISKFGMYCYQAVRAPNVFRLEASNDKVSWTIMKSVTQSPFPVYQWVYFNVP